MARNLEIKVASTEEQLHTIRLRASRLTAAPIQVLEQTDTYFTVHHGRLKLREVIDMVSSDQTAQLIVYQRPDQRESRWSDYQITELATDVAAGIKSALTIACGIKTSVVKRRAVAIWRRTRIHLDEVVGLGWFIELETVAQAGDLGIDVKEEHEQVIRMLGLDELPVIAGSYSDLIVAQRESSDSDRIPKEQQA